MKNPLRLINDAVSEVGIILAQGTGEIVQRCANPDTTLCTFAKAVADERWADAVREYRKAVPLWPFSEEAQMQVQSASYVLHERCRTIWNTYAKDKVSL